MVGGEATEAGEAKRRAEAVDSERRRAHEDGGPPPALSAAAAAVPNDINLDATTMVAMTRFTSTYSTAGVSHPRAASNIFFPSPAVATNLSTLAIANSRLLRGWVPQSRG
jgi:hypothetical protein